MRTLQRYAKLQERLPLCPAGGNRIMLQLSTAAAAAMMLLERACNSSKEDPRATLELELIVQEALQSHCAVFKSILCAKAIELGWCS